MEVYSGPIRVDGRSRLHSIIHDITERKKAQSELELAARVITGAAEGVVVTDQHAKILAVNPAFTEITGFAQSEAIGQTPKILASGRQSQNFYQAMWEDLIAKGTWAGEIWNRKKDGTVYPEWLSISRTGSGEDMRYIAIFSDITRRKADEERIRRLAHYDPLTGLPNRALLFDRATQAISLCRRGEMPLALMFIDVDHFKRINDTLGHNLGDEILVALSQRLTAILRVEDTVCRLGGDEFVILLPEIGAEGAAHVATKLVESIQTPLNVSGGISVTLSIGITMFPDDGNDFEILCKNADTAMYRAKAEGRNGFRFYTAEMQKKAARHWELEHALRSALAKGELTVHYQPQLSLDSSTVTGVEALLRWTHPQLGPVSPVEFIPIAEEIGLITTIGQWVLRCAVKQAVSWIKSGRENLVMSVNVSAAQLREVGLVEQILNILQEEGLPAKNLELEITESLAMQDPALAIRMIKNLRDAGISVAVDDFGTGHSSLSSLKRFNFSRLKIDRSFIQEIAVEPESRAIVRAILGISEALGLATIAEGVENAEQLNTLRELGCEDSQGFLLAIPMPAEDATRWMESQAPLGR